MAIAPAEPRNWAPLDQGITSINGQPRAMNGSSIERCHAQPLDNRDMVLKPLPLSSQRAFTLFEMLIAMAIAAILLAVALPAYQDSVRRGRRADAVAALSAAQLSQERFRANVASYAGSLSDLQGVSATSPDGHYSIAVTAAAHGYSGGD